MSDTEATSRPDFSIVKGTPTDEELAAVIAALSSRTPTAPDAPRQPSPSGWSAYWRTVRTPTHPGPGVWRMSGRG
ncbi:MAG TPA: acyl-CoA carboxylase subunit epsilon [Propionibacteriaceae bacterium]